MERITIKPRLILLSDLWGFEQSLWIEAYRSNLSNSFELVLYDCCRLAGISPSNISKTKLHEQFVNGGIENAVSNLLALEKEPVIILAFSIGGTIAWKAGMRGLNMNALFALSATRIRYEESAPMKENIKLYFGEKDLYKPQKDWLARFNLDYEFLANQGHDFYKDASIAKRICQEIRA